MLRFQVNDLGEHRLLEHPEGPIEFGRREQRDRIARCVLRSTGVAPDHLRVEEVADGQVRVENLSPEQTVAVPGRKSLGPGTDCRVGLPVRLVVGEAVIDIERAESEPLETIETPVRRHGPSDADPSLLQLSSTLTPETLTRWFETVITVQRTPADSPEFYLQTARALVALVGLDRGLVLLRREDRWEVAARFPQRGSGGEHEFSQTILERVLREQRTFYQTTPPGGSDSLKGIKAVVASPILDSSDQVVGVVYGSRTRSIPSRGISIGPLEARVVQVLASVVAVGLDRLEQEAELSRLRIQFEQFFSPQLARELERNPLLLEGQERPVTVLFSDIRGFSRLAERLGPRDSCALVADVMERITGCIRETDGVVVDFAGDGLLAMWNAPADQPDHATRACRAALAILEELPQLSADWHDRLGGPLDLSIGVNTGPALVGNVGSRHKFKYGPLGHTVNLANRVEATTQRLGISALITGSTQALAGETFATRRLCRGHLEGVRGAVDLFELHAMSATPEWQARRDAYETALSLFENGQWAAAGRVLYPLMDNPEGAYDIPTLDLMTRVVECLKDPPVPFSPVVELSPKGPKE